MNLYKDLLKKNLMGEVQSEALRNNLSKRPYFSVFEAFSLLDKNEQGFITFDEIKEILIDHGIFATAIDLKGLVLRYDKNLDGKITYAEFVSEISPKSPQKI